MQIRQATLADAEPLAALLQALTAAGKRTRPDDVDFVRTAYINPPNQIRCSVAEDGGVLLGLQSLILAQPDNPWGVTPGWGITGTHIHPEAARRGIGRALFASTLEAARAANLPALDATIQETNAEGLAYYEAMGYRSYRTFGTAICKRFDLAP